MRHGPRAFTPKNAPKRGRTQTEWRAKPGLPLGPSAAQRRGGNSKYRGAGWRSHGREADNTQEWFSRSEMPRPLCAANPKVGPTDRTRGSPQGWRRKPTSTCPSGNGDQLQPVSPPGEIPDRSKGRANRLAMWEEEEPPLSRRADYEICDGVTFLMLRITKVPGGRSRSAKNHDFKFPYQIMIFFFTPLSGPRAPNGK